MAALDELPGRWPTDPFVVGDFHRWLGPVVWGGADALLFAVRAGSGRHALVGVGVQLGGIATAPGCRGRGLGSAVTAAAARAGTTATGRASLALYADNAVAYRVYRRLGFRLHQPVETRRPA
ncbi:GNAT family N-acetyltransferase [Georgenia sp. MJ173]